MCGLEEERAVETSSSLQIVASNVSLKTVLKKEERIQQPIRVQAVTVPGCVQLMEFITLTGHGKLKSLSVY